MNMNKIIIYILLVLLYLGLSKSLSPSEYGVNYVFNNKSLEKIIGPGPVSVILTDIHSTGFIIKTYYHKYKVVYAFQGYEEIIARTSSKFTSIHKEHIGLSIFRRYEDGKVNFTSLPPGSIFIGDRNFGSWIKDRDNEKIWKFYRAYRHLPAYLGWGKFKPSYKFYQENQVRMNNDKTFYGFNDEFGAQGSITKEFFPNYFKRKSETDINFKQFIKDYLKKNF